VYLLDTSVWIEVFRKKSPLDLTAVLDLDEVVTCLLVVQEVLQGFRDERAFRLARESMLAFPMVDSPLEHDVVERAVELYRAARRVGRTVRSSVDCLIAASAIGHDLTVLHVDRDYEELAGVSTLRQQRLVPR
jgi:predicted nucleic acid-binding protein